ncbi:MAG: 2-hydroxyacyl-CoA dehydratase family protein, partial [Dehalococcoidia bacterium]|nr:2-hydroxyacyl-CoA dehydratase family protein [Dehalococcoidia bacterium]
MAVERRYRTRPIECWQKAKELRLNHYKQIVSAREDGKLMVTGGAETPQPLLTGLGEFAFLAGEPYGATIGNEPEMSQQCCEAAESRGFARDLCGYMKNYWGSMYTDRFFYGGPFPRPDFCFQLHFCDSHAKWFQVVAEHYGVPYFSLDYPVLGRHERNDTRRDYMAGQMLDFIDWAQKVTGRGYDDEKMIQACRNEFQSSSLWGEVMLENQHIPAPLDQKSIFSLYIIAVLMRDTRESVDFNRLMLDEVRGRVADGIAALPDERCRLVDDSPPPWYFLRLYRYMEKYGVVVVASHYSILLAGAVEEGPDGRWGRALSPEERGMPMKTREDACRALAQFYLDRHIFDTFFTGEAKARIHSRIVREWQAEGL